MTQSPVSSHTPHQIEDASKKKHGSSDTHTDVSPVPVHDVPIVPASSEKATPNFQELLEKNIKWSQVIYHQNRKIQRRLTWMTVGNYIRLFLILLPLILGVFFISDFLSQNGEFVSGALKHWQEYLEIFQSP